MKENGICTQVAVVIAARKTWEKIRADQSLTYDEDQDTLNNAYRNYEFELQQIKNPLILKEVNNYQPAEIED